MGVHIFPILNPSSLPIPSLWSSQCTSPEHPVSCIEPGLAIHFRYDDIMFQCHSPKSSHPRPLPQNPKDCSIHLCLFCCLTCRVIVTIFLQYSGFLSEEGSVRQRPPHRGKSVSSSRAWREHGPAPHLDSKLWTSRTLRVHFGCSK